MNINKLFRTHGKKIMGIVSIGLMIAWGLGGIAGKQGGVLDTTYGRVRDHGFSHGSVVAANQEWELLKTYVRYPYQPYGNASPIMIPATYILGGDAVYQIEHHPAMYYLLQREAHDMGITVSADVLAEYRRSKFQEIAGASADVDDHLAAAEANLLLVDAAFHAVAANAKISDPMIRRAMALRLQAVSVNAVLFDAKNYLTKLSKPQDSSAWARQISAQFDKYCNVDPDDALDGFGYRVPNEVKLQYLTIDRKVVDKLVSADLTDLDARKYYLTHQDRFPASQPAAAAFQLGPVLPQAPATRPFADVRQEVYQTLTKQRADDLIADILRDIAATASTDFVAYRHAVHPHGTTTEPADETLAPPSSLGVPVNTFDYLNKKSDYLLALAQHVQQKFGILPTVEWLPNWQDTADLFAIHGIGHAFYTLPSSTGRGEGSHIGFPDYAMQYVDKYYSAEERRNRTSDVRLLSEWETSPAFQDDDGNIYLFRIAEARPAHAAESQWDIQDEVTADVRLSEAYKLALVDAQQFFPKALREGLHSAAKVADRPIITTGLFENNSRIADVPHLELPTLSARLFIRKSFDLLMANGDEQLDKDHPVGLIELPQVHKVAVVQIDDVRRLWSMADQGAYTFSMRVQENNQMEQALRQRWFNFDNLSARLDYKPARTDDSTAKPADESNAPAPLTPLNPLQDLSGS